MAKLCQLQARVLMGLVAITVCLPVSVEASDWLYTFRQGDTLWSVCKEYTNKSNCWLELGPINSIDANRRIAPGTRIKIPASWLKVPPAKVKIFYVQGDARYLLPGKESEVAQPGIELPVGSSIITGSGTVTLSFADGSSMLLESNSELTLDALSSFELNGMVDTTVRLNRGTLKTRVLKRQPRSRFNTITPSAVAAVRGTEYQVNLVNRDTNKENAQLATLVSVYNGLVDVGAQQKIYPVPATFGIVTEPGQSPQEPVKLLDAPSYVSMVRVHYIDMNTAKTQAEPVAIDWADMNSASGYQLKVLAEVKGATSDADKQIQSYDISESEVQINGLTEGCYRLQLRAIDRQGLHGLAANAPICLQRRIASPVLNLEQAATSDASVSKVEWSAVPGAIAYKIEVADSERFTSIVNTFTTSETGYAFEHDQTVYLRVQAMASEGNISQLSDSLMLSPAPKEELDWGFLIPVGLYFIGLIFI